MAMSNWPPTCYGAVSYTHLDVYKRQVLAYKFKGRRFDCGSAEGYVQATNFCFDNRHKTHPVTASPRLQAV